MVLALVQVTLTALGAREVGALLMRGRLAGTDPALRWALEAALGLQLVSWAVFVLATSGALTIPVLTALVAAVATFAALGAWRRRDRLRLPHPGVLESFALVATAGWIVMVAFVAAVPATAIDELIYHLEVPRRMLESGGMMRFTDNVYAYFPQGADQLAMLGLGVTGEIGARLFHGLFGLLTALAIFGAARPLAGSKGAAIGALAFLTVPTVMLIASWAYVDLAFTAYGLLGILLAVRVLQARAAGAVDLEAAVLCGILCGAAWTVKYTGLQLTLLVILVTLVDHVAGRRSRPPAEVLTIGAVAATLAAPFLLRNVWLTGWPLFPFATGPLPLTAGINWDADRASLFVSWLTRFGGDADRGLIDQLLGIAGVFFRGRFGDLTAFDGVVGPVLLLGLAALWPPRSRQVSLLGAFWLVLSLTWALTTAQARFLLPALAAAAVLVAVAAGRSRLVAGLAVIGIGIGAVQGGARVMATEPIRYLAGEESRDEYMARNVAGYGLYQEANALLTETDRLYLVNMRTFGYLLHLAGDGAGEPFPSGWRGDYVFQQHSLTAALAEGPQAAYDFLLDLGVTHLMVDERLTLTPQALDENEMRALGQLLGVAERMAVDPRNSAMSLWRLRTRRRS